MGDIDVFEFFGQTFTLFLEGIKKVEFPIINMNLWDIFKGSIVIGLGIFAVKKLFGAESSTGTSDSVDSIAESRRRKRHK